MSVPYTYLIKCIPENKFYYGVRFAKNCNPNELWKKYFTSSKYVHSLIEKYGKESFDYEIRKIFSDSESARIWENKVLKRMNVVENNLFINKTDNISFSPNVCGHNKGKCGKKHNRYGHKNKFLSEYNKLNPKNGSKNGMYGRTGNLHPNFGKKNEDCKIFGVPRNDLKEIVICPYCNKSGKLGGMQRWHFERCKFKI